MRGLFLSMGRSSIDLPKPLIRRISHNELEDATQPDCAAGANVLMHTVLALAGVAS